MLAINREMKSEDLGNWLSLSSVISLSNNRLYEGLGFEAQELCNVTNINNVYKSKAICSRVNKGREGDSISIL